MFQLKLDKNGLTIEHISNSINKIVDSGDECPYSPQVFYPKNSIKMRENIPYKLKKNYNLMVLNTGSYIIYNQKNQAIIDHSILDILNRFNLKEIRHNIKLRDILHKLEFISYE